MTRNEIMERLDELQERRRMLVRQIWGAPRHIAEEIEPDLKTTNLEIQSLIVKLGELPNVTTAQTP